MKKIFKYPLDITSIQILSMPSNAKMLCVQKQKTIEGICLWALVDPNAEKETRRIYIIGTGHEMEKDNLEYIDTVQEMNGELVWHVFVEKN